MSLQDLFNISNLTFSFSVHSADGFVVEFVHVVSKEIYRPLTNGPQDLKQTGFWQEGRGKGLGFGAPFTFFAGGHLRVPPNTEYYSTRIKMKFESTLQKLPTKKSSFPSSSLLELGKFYPPGKITLVHLQLSHS